MSTQLLTFSSLYPNSCQPGYGLFVEARLKQLLSRGNYKSRVIAPVPWFFSGAKIFGQYGRFARVPDYENYNDIPVWHPRYKLLPKIGMNLSPGTMHQSVKKLLSTWNDVDFRPAILDAHYFYPDGVAASYLAKELDIPLMITARGSDINLISSYSRPLQKMREAADQCSAIVAVSQALADKMAELGFDRDKIHVLRNGVDLDFFRPVDRDTIRKKLNLSGRVVLSVGNLVPLKGHDLIIDALSDLPDTTLVIAGSGPLEDLLRKQVDEKQLSDRVRFAGQVKPEDLRDLYNAADMLVLASSREGLANVLLESIACGTPVIATAVGGNPEVVSDIAAGVIVNERSPQGLVNGLQELEKAAIPRSETRQFAGNFGWQDTCHKLDALIQRII